jgi:uncharacterized protein YkwD
VKARLALQGLSAAAALALGACASAPAKPADPFKAAASSIEQAEYARASDYASPEMRSAHDKLNAARLLAQKATQDNSPQEKQQAEWLAEEASSDAELAQAKAADVRAQNALHQAAQPGS